MTFDGTITLGHIVQLAGLTFAIVAAYFKLDKRIALLKLELETSLRVFQAEIKQETERELSEMRESLNRVWSELNQQKGSRLRNGFSTRPNTRNRQDCD